METMLFLLMSIAVMWRITVEGRYPVDGAAVFALTAMAMWTKRRTAENMDAALLLVPCTLYVRVYFLDEEDDVLNARRMFWTGVALTLLSVATIREDGRLSRSANRCERCILAQGTPLLLIHMYLNVEESDVNLVHFVLKDNGASVSRIAIFLMWFALLLVAIPLIAILRQTMPKIVVRKLFHLLATGLFMPVVMMDPDLLSVSYGAASALFVTIELIRSRVSVIDRYMRLFTDHRDVGPVIFSHIYLLVGCAVPHWMVPNNGATLPMCAGIIAVGVGDAVAAIVGTWAGRHKWLGTSKSIEGTCAGALAMMLVAASLVPPPLDHAKLTVLGTIVAMTALMETVTSHMDNLILPLYFFVLLSVAGQLNG